MLKNKLKYQSSPNTNIFPFRLDIALVEKGKGLMYFSVCNFRIFCERYHQRCWFFLWMMFILLEYLLFEVVFDGKIQFKWVEEERIIYYFFESNLNKWMLPNVSNSCSTRKTSNIAFLELKTILLIHIMYFEKKKKNNLLIISFNSSKH